MQKYQSGNILWFVLIGIVLLGTITSLLTRSSSSTNETGNIEQLTVSTSSMLQHTNGIEKAVQQMLVRGTSESDLCFDTTEWGTSAYDFSECTIDSNKIYDTSGGGMTWQDIPERIKVDIPYIVTASFNIQDVGTASTDLIIQGKTTKEACMQANKILGITNAASDAPEDNTDNTAVEFTGSYTAAAGDATIGEDFSGFSRQKAGCRKNIPGKDRA